MGAQDEKRSLMRRVIHEQAARGLVWGIYTIPTPAAVKRWKTRYRLMSGHAYYDGQTAAEAYARALLAAFATGSSSASSVLA